MQLKELQVAAGLFEAAIRERLRVGETAVDQLRIAFAEVQKFDFWWVGRADDNIRFNAAIGAVLLQRQGDLEFRAEVERQIQFLASLTAAQQGVPVDFVTLLSGLAEEPPFVLMTMYQEAAQQ